VTLVPPPLGAAVALAVPAPVVVSAEVAGLSDFFSSDEQPDRPAMTIAAPPIATTNPRFTTVLLRVVVTRQDRRIISASMVRRPRADMRLREKFACALTSRWLRPNERVDGHSAFARFDILPSGTVAPRMQTFERPTHVSAICLNFLMLQSIARFLTKTAGRCGWHG
jgi:hypothetical protein